MVPGVSPVIVAEVKAALAVCAQFVQVAADDSLYSTFTSVMPVVSTGSVHVAVNLSVCPVLTVPTFESATERGVRGSVRVPAVLMPCRPYFRVRYDST